MNIISLPRPILMLGLIFTLSSVRAVDVKLPFVGHLSDGEAPANGTKTMRFQILEATGTVRYETGPLSIPVSNGTFSIILGTYAQAPLDSSVFSTFGLKLRVIVEGVTLSPDLDVPFSAYAANADTATTANNFTGSLAGDVTGTQNATTVSTIQGRPASSLAWASSLNTFTAEQVFQPTPDSLSILVRQTLAPSPTSDIFRVENGDGSATHFRVNSSGLLSWPGLAAGSISGNAATASSADSLNGHHAHEFAFLGEQNIFTAGQTFRPTSDSSSIVVRQTSHSSPTRDIFSVEKADSTDSFFRVNSSGQIIWPGLALGSISGNAATATDASLLNGRPSSYYTDIENLTGTIPDDRLGSQIARLNRPQTWPSPQTFESVTLSWHGPDSGNILEVENGATGLPYFRVDGSGTTSWRGSANGDIAGHAATATTADLLDGHDSTAFPLLDVINVFTAEQVFQPTPDSLSILVRQTLAPSPTSDIFRIENGDGSATHFRVNSSGLLSWPGLAAGSISGNAATASSADSLNGHHAHEFAFLGEQNIFTAGQAFQATLDTSSVVVRQSAAVSPSRDVFAVERADGHDSFFRIDSSGQVIWPGLALGSISGNAATATDASLLNGRPGSFYTDAANLSGTVSDAQLSPHVALLNESQTFLASKTFQPVTDNPGVVIRQTSAASPTGDVFQVQSSDAATYLRVNSSGQVSWTGTAEGSISGNAATANDASQLNGHPGSYYTDGANLTGTIPDVRLSANVALLNAGQSFTVAPLFSAAGAPFSVSSSTRVDNLNADRIDGISSEVLARTDIANVFADLQTFNAAVTFASPSGPPFEVTSSTRVDNLNAQFIDGLNSDQFARRDAANTFAATQTIQPATDSPSLIVLQTSVPSPTSDIFAVQSGDGSSSYLRVNASGQLGWLGTAQGSISGNAASASDASLLNGHAGSFYQDAGNLSGTLADGRLAGSYSDAVNFSNAGNTFSGTYSGNGAALTGLNASSLLTGTTAPARGGTGIDSSGAAVGSILYTVSPGTWDLLPAGSGGQVLKIVDGRPAWGTDDIGTPGINIAGGTGITTSSTTPSDWTVSINSTVVPLKSAPNTFTASQSIELNDGALKALVVRGAETQTANLQEWQDASGAALASVDSNGAFTAASLSLNANLQMFGGNAGLGRAALVNTLEVAGDASKDIPGVWAANSDRRIKTDVETITNALDTLDNVRLVSFRYTDEYRAGHPSIKDRRYMNVLAQEFQKVFPDNVKGSGEKLASGEEILQVDTYPLTIYSAAAVQELHHQMKERDARIADLEKSVAELKRLVGLLAGSK